MARRSKTRAKSIRPVRRMPDRRPAAAVPVVEPKSRSQWLALGSILAITALVYLRSLGNGFVSDDRFMTEGNPHIGEWSFLWKSLISEEWWFRATPGSRYKPLVDIWFGLDYHIFGLNPPGWHATSIAVHLIAVWLVFEIAARLTRDRQTGLLAALVFALLPVHTAAVAWISAISLLLGAVFEFAAFYAFITRDVAPRRNLILALTLYAAALGSHESAVAFPALVGLYVFFFESRRPTASDSRTAGELWQQLQLTLMRTAPFLAEALLYMVVRRLVLGFFVLHTVSGSTTQTLLTIPRVLMTYLLVLPALSTAGFAHRQLMVTDPQQAIFVTSAFSPDFWVPVLALATLAAGFVFLVRRSGRRGLYLFCAGWILIAIAPLLNLKGIVHEMFVQDDYLYLASLGWCVMFADFVIHAARRWAGARQRLVWGGAAVLLALYAVTVWSAQGLWHDNGALFARCVKVFPEAVSCHSALGAFYKLNGNLTLAEREFSEAIRLDPEASAYSLFHLGGTHAMQGKYAQASDEMARAIGQTGGAGIADYLILARTADLAGELDRVEKALNAIEALPGGREEAALARAEMKIAHNDPAGAETILQGLTASNPADDEVWSTLGLALLSQKRYEQALSAYQRAAKLSPNDNLPHFFLAKIFHLMGRDQEALAQCRLALALEPNDGMTKALMAQIAPGLRSSR